MTRDRSSFKFLSYIESIFFYILQQQTLHLFEILTSDLGKAENALRTTSITVFESSTSGI